MNRHRWLALVILCTASLMVILDGTIVTVALPTIQADLGFSSGSLSWVMNSYLIAFGGLLLLSGRLGDLAGRKRLFLAGLAVFVLASLACGLAGSPGLLVTARFVQGTGAAMASAVVLGMIVRLFPEPAELSRAIAAFAFTGAVGASAGLVFGGLLVQYASWHWIFFVNLPVGLATGIAGWRVLAADPGSGLRAGADGFGALLATSGVMLGVLAIAAPAHWQAGLIAAALLAGFAVRQATARTPLLPPRLLASRTVAGANLTQLPVIGAAMGFQVIVTLYLQRALGYRPAAAGLGLLPTAAVIAAVSLGLSARLTSRFGARRLLLGGLVMITAALVLLTGIPAHAGYLTRLLPVLVLFGAGGGLTLPAVTALGMSGATDADAGVISGVFNTTQQLGGALGVAALTSLAAGRTGSGTSAQALTSGYHLAWAAGAGLAAASVAVAAVALRPRKSAPQAPEANPGAAPDGAHPAGPAGASGRQAESLRSAAERPSQRGCRMSPSSTSDAYPVAVVHEQHAAPRDHHCPARPARTARPLRARPRSGQYRDGDVPGRLRAPCRPRRARHPSRHRQPQPAAGSQPDRRRPSRALR